MSPEKAEQLLRQEVASGSPLGQALTILLEHAELANYRQSVRSSDPYTTARICGRGEGIHSITTRIAPVKQSAPMAGPGTLPQEN